jgi:hypothetical protein
MFTDQIVTMTTGTNRNKLMVVISTARTATTIMDMATVLTTDTHIKENMCMGLIVTMAKHHVHVEEAFVTAVN